MTTSTGGSSLDPDGYTVTVDGTTSQAIATNNSTGITFTGLAAGSHSAALSGVAANCSVTSANPQTVNVPSGGTVTAAFTVNCTTPPGNLTVSTSSSGASIPSSYTVTVDGSQSQTVASSGNVTFTGLSATSHTVALSLPGNCSVTNGSASRSVTVPSGGTATVSYTVTCTAPNSAPVVNAGPDETAVTGLLYSTSVSFSDANHNGPWSYTINWGDGNTSTGSWTGEGSHTISHTYVVLALKTFTVTVTVTDAAGASGSDSKVVTVLLL